jgi:hypothetical protein
MRGTIKEPDGKEIRMIMELVPDIVTNLCQYIDLFYFPHVAWQSHGFEEADPVGKNTFDSSVNQEKVSGSGNGRIV